MFLVLLFIVSSCILPKYITNITRYGKLEDTSNKTVTVVGLDRVYINDYEKTFYKNFENNLVFSHIFADMFSKSMENENVFSEVTSEIFVDWNHINTMTSKKSYLKIEALFEECKTDYLFFIDEFEINRKVSVLNTTYNTEANMQTTNLYEFLILKATVKIFDTKTHAPIL